MRWRAKEGEDGFTVLEFLISVGVAMAMFLVALPVYFMVRASAYNTSVEDSVAGTVHAVEAQVLAEGLNNFTEKTKGVNLVREDATVLKVTGPDGTGVGTLNGFEVRGWNPHSAKYPDASHPYLYTTDTEDFSETN